MSRLESMMELFMRITTGIVIVTAIFIGIFWDGKCNIGVEILWQILFVAALCTLGYLIFPIDSKKEISKKSMLVRMIIYYCYINVVVLVSGGKFGWYLLSNWKQVLGMVVAIATVFIIVEMITYQAESRVAKQMNERLRER